MINAEEEIRDELSYRKEEDHDNRFQPREILTTVGSYSIVARNGWKGVAMGKTIVIPTVYDKVELLTLGINVIAVCSILYKKDVWLMRGNTGENILPPFYDDILTSPHYDGIVFRNDNMEGLYCLRRHKIIFDVEYAKVSLNTDSLRIWAQVQDGLWTFRNPDTEEMTTVNGSIVPVEHTDFAGYVASDGNVVFLDGDSYQFRKAVVAYGGRMQLINSRLNKVYYADANGFIMNL